MEFIFNVDFGLTNIKFVIPSIKILQMNHYKQVIFFIIVFSVITLTSCENTKVCDCDDLNRQFFTIVDDNTNLNLLFGANKRYSFDSIDVFSIEVRNGHNFRRDFSIERLQSDSVFALRLDNQNVKRYFISFDLNGLDTIDISTIFLGGGCCGDRHIIDSLKFKCNQNNQWILKK